MFQPLSHKVSFYSAKKNTEEEEEDATQHQGEAHVTKTVQVPQTVRVVTRKPLKTACAPQEAEGCSQRDPTEQKLETDDGEKVFMSGFICRCGHRSGRAPTIKARVDLKHLTKQISQVVFVERG